MPGATMSVPKSLVCKFAVLLSSITFGLSCQAGISEQTGETPVLEQAQAEIVKIATEGRWDISLTGYAYHSKNTYTDGQLQQLNAKAWGGGIGKIIRTESGNDESIYAMVFRDSSRHLQWSAGYSYQWIFPVTSTGLEVGAGLTAGVISRKDCFNRIPFPALLPLASIGSKDIKLMATYVPPISISKGNGKKSKGNLALLFIKFAFD